jgi:hypothetical protein
MFPFRLTATAWAGHGLFMHGLLAHAYHLALHILAVGLNPVWRPFGVALAVALAGRVAGLARLPQGAGLVAAGAVLAGWVVQDWPLLATWPPPPIARLVGLAVLVLVEGRVPESRGRRGGKAPIWLLPVFAACAAWWMRGAPMDGAGIVNCMPVFLGLCAALPLARRLARGDSGWGCVAVASALAGGLLVTGAAPHWARAALVPGLAALALIGLPAAASALAGAITVAAATALVASDRGRLVPVDVACVIPLLAWVLVPRFKRAGRHAPPMPAVLAAAICVALAWAARRVLI